MNSSETKRTPIRLTGLQVTDVSVFEAFQADLQDFRDRIDAFEETLETVSGLEDAEGLINDVSLIKARLLDISAGLGVMQGTDAIIAASVVDVSSYAHGLVIPVIPSAVSYFDNDAGYLTGHQDISGLASKAALNDVSVYAHSLVIPEIPSNVSAFTNDTGYLTQHQSLAGLATQAALNDVSAYAHSIQVSETYDDTEIRSAIEDVSVYARSIEIPVVPTKVSDLTNDAGYLTQHQSLRGLATDASLQEVADSIPEAYDDSSLAQAIEDVSTYARSLATDASLQEAVEHADSGDASVVDYIDTEIGGSLDQVLNEELEDGFATKSWTERTVMGMIPRSVSAFFNDAGYLTEHQSLEGLATDASLAEVKALIPAAPAAYDDTSLKGYVDAQDASLKTYIDAEIGGRIDEVLDGSLAGFATRDYVDQQIAGIVIPEVENYDDTSLTQAVDDISAYAHGLVIPTVPSNVSAFTNDAGYLDASALDASFLDPVIEKFGDTDTVLDEILTGSVTQIDSSLLDILGEDVQ